jgi:hypothetical protein
MKFAITGFVAPDASNVLNQIANPFAEAFRYEIADLVLECSAGLMVFSPIIIPASLGSVANESSLKPRQSAIMISRNIDHETWLASDKSERLRLYAGALSNGLLDLAPKPLSFADLDVLRLAIQRAANEVITT